MRRVFICKWRMSYKFTVVIVRPSQCMKQTFRSSDNKKNLEVALDLALQALKEDVLLGTTRSRVAFVIGDKVIRPLHVESYQLIESTKMIEKDIRQMNLQMGIGLLQQMDMVLGCIHEEINSKQAKKLGADIFKRGEYEFRIITCKDGPKSDHLEVCMDFEESFKKLHDKVVPYIKVFVLEPKEYLDVKDSAVMDEEIGLLQQTNPCVEVIKLHEHLNFLPGPFFKRISHYCRFTGFFEVSPDFKISVKVFTKTQEILPPSLKTYSKFSNPENPSILSGKILTTRTYHESQNQDRVVESEHKIKGYYYGHDLIPIPQEVYQQIENAGKKEAKELKLLGFTSGKRWRREYLIGRGDVILPSSKDQRDIIAYKALIEAMIDLNVVAYCSFAARNGGRAILYGLFPFQEEDKSLQLFGAQLPTGEDIREFSFSRLKQASDVQLDVMEEFVNANEIPDEVADPHNIFEPERQLILENLYARAFAILDQAETPLNRGLSMGMNSVIFPPLIKDSNQNYMNLAKVFNLKEHEIKKNQKKEKVWWKSALISNTTSTASNPQLVEEGLAAAKSDQINGKKNDDNQYPKHLTSHISEVRPIHDFREMMDDRKTDLIDRAIHEMKRVVKKILDNFLPGDTNAKPTECLHELRKACIEHDEYQAFNDFLRELRLNCPAGSVNFKAFWQKNVNERLSLIGNASCKLSDVTEDESEVFLNEIEKLCTSTSDGAQKRAQYVDTFNDIE